LIDRYNFYAGTSACHDIANKKFSSQSRITIKLAATFINTSRLKNLYYTRIGIYRGFYFIVIAILRYNALVIMRRSRRCKIIFMDIKNRFLSRSMKFQVCTSIIM